VALLDVEQLVQPWLDVPVGIRTLDLIAKGLPPLTS
jgi:hypothetical protein